MKKLLTIALMAVLASLCYASPVFIQPVNNQNFTLAEDMNFVYMVTATDPFLPILFTDTSHDPEVGFNCLSKKQWNSTSALMNFTCTNSFVGYYSFNLIATNNISQATLITVHFNITNTNDVPYVTGNSTMLQVDENSSLTLWITIFDDDLVYGDLINYTWYLDSVNSSKLLYTYVNSTYSNATYSPIIEDWDHGLHNITVIATDQSNTSANFTWPITVNNVNRPPVNNKTFANVTWMEDTNRTNVFTLWDHFYDLDTNGTWCELDTGNCLEFGYVVVGGNASAITIILDANSTNSSTNASLYPAPDWFGELNISFTLNDQTDINLSNVITLRVLNVNDPPVIENISNQSSRANTYWHYQVNASDKEGDNLTYYISSAISNITINATGYITMESNSSDTGLQIVNVTVSDGMSNTSLLFNMTIRPNERPFIIPFGNKSVVQHYTFNLTANGSDADHNNLTFWTNSSLINPGIRLNESAWTFNFTPHNQTLVGNYSVRMWVADIYNSTNYYDFVIEVIDLPLSPHIYNFSVPNNEIKVNLTLNLTVYAFDEDGDFDIFMDNTTIFNITTEGKGSIYTNASGRILYTPNVTGYHEINVSAVDLRGNLNWTLFIINVTQNRAPGWFQFDDMVCEEMETCSQLVIAKDPDWQDKIIYGDNVSDFDINRATGYISWVPLANKNFTATIWAFDGTVNISTVITINITDINDPPYFLDNVSNLSSWKSVTENSTTLVEIIAGDEEYNRTGEMLNLSIHWINFTNIIGITTNGTDLFDYDSFVVNADNTTSGFINFTPDEYQVGTWWVNLSVRDNETTVSTVFSFVVQNINNPPEVNWTLSYPLQNISMSSNLSFFEFNGTENESLSFSALAKDPDYDTMTFTWTAIDEHEGTYQIGTGQVLNYRLPFTAHENHTIVLTVTDGKGGSAQIHWLVHAKNVNRGVTFGTYEYELDSDKGAFNHTEVNGSSLSVSMRNATHYYNQSDFVSEALDFKTTSLDLPRIKYFNITYSINRTASNCSNCSNCTCVNTTQADLPATLYTKTTNQLFENKWDNVTDFQIESDDYRYLKFKAHFNLSNDTQGANISNLVIRYGISDVQVGAETEYAAWLDLRNFFHDLDEDDELHYDYWTPVGGSLVNISILQGYYVRISFLKSGNVELYFNATDPYGEHAQSNLISINITSSENQPTSGSTGSTSSGGSSGSKTKTKTEIEYKYKVITEPVSLDIIHPDDVTIFENETMLVPLILRNNEDFDLTGLSISASTDENALSLDLDRTYIPTLSRNSQDVVMLTVDMLGVYGSYSINVNVSVENPEYDDSAQININTLKRAREEPEASTLKLSFVSDLLAENEICAELTEYIDRAREYFDSGDEKSGNELLDQFVHDCRVLISQNEPHEEAPKSLLQTIYEKIRFNDDMLTMVATIVGVLVMILLITLVALYKHY